MFPLGIEKDQCHEVGQESFNLQLLILVIQVGYTTEKLLTK